MNGEGEECGGLLGQIPMAPVAAFGLQAVYCFFFKASEIKEAIILERPLPSVEKMGWSERRVVSR